MAFAGDLAGKNIVVTGSSMGIGQAVAVKLAEEGANVVINARGESGLTETLALIADKPGKVVSCCGSVADYEFCETLITTCVETFGSIDGLINCAGIAEPQGTSILNIEKDDWHNLIDVHLHGTFNTCRHAAPVMKKQGYGVIINTSSHAFMGMYGGTGYAAGKGGVNSLSNAMSMDLKEHNIRVNTICPGAKTRLSTGDDYESLIGELNDRGLLDDSLMEQSLNPPDPAYVAALYAYLMSDRARDISGRLFWAAGGYLGSFHKNGDQLIAFKNHEHNPPWELDEIHKKLGKKFAQPEAIFQVLYSGNAAKFLMRQSLLIKLANSRLAQWLVAMKEKFLTGNALD